MDVCSDSKQIEMAEGAEAMAVEAPPSSSGPFVMPEQVRGRHTLGNCFARVRGHWAESDDYARLPLPRRRVAPNA